MHAISRSPDPRYYLAGFPEEPHASLRDARLEAGRKQHQGDRRSFTIYHRGQAVDVKRY